MKRKRKKPNRREQLIFEEDVKRITARAKRDRAVKGKVKR